MGTEIHKDGRRAAVALLTAGSDRPYVFVLATELMSKGATMDLIGR